MSGPDRAALLADRAQLFEQLAAMTTRAEKAESERDAMAEWAAGWILRAREALYREGWEEGMSAGEAGEALTDVLANLGCDAGTEDPAQVAKAKRLLAMKLPYSPPVGKSPTKRPRHAVTGDASKCSYCGHPINSATCQKSHP